MRSRRRELDRKYFKILKDEFVLCLKEAKAGLSLCSNPVEALAILEAKITEFNNVSAIPIFSRVFAEQYKESTRNFVLQSLEKKAFSFSWDILDKRAIETINSNSFFMINQYFENSQKKEVKEALINAFSSGESIKELSGFINNFSLKMTSYLKMFLETNVTTARAIGVVNCLQKYNVKYSKIFGYDDELTCPICRNMIGRIVSVDAQVEARDKLLNIDYASMGYEKAKEKIKKISTWYSASDFQKMGISSVEGMSRKENIKNTSQVMKRGLEFPPFHARCRCEVVIEAN